jgi:hypothetical protein
MNKEQKVAACKLLNLLMALVVHVDFDKQARQDIWDAAEAFGITRLDLLGAVAHESDINRS